MAELTDATADEGTYLESGGVLTLISGRLPSLRHPGDMLRVSVRFTDFDSFEAVAANVRTLHGRKQAYLARHRDGIFEK